MQVYLKGQRQPVTLTEVERDDKLGVIGTTATGKRFVARRDQIGEPLPIRHPYRVYLTNGAFVRVIDPAFEAVEKEMFNLSTDKEITLTLDDGSTVTVTVGGIRSILSATPEDELNTLVAGNGHSEDDE